MRLTKSRFISSLRGSREIKTPPTSQPCLTLLPLPLPASTAAVGMMDDLVDTEEKNHQAPQLVLEKTQCSEIFIVLTK